MTRFFDVVLSLAGLVVLAPGFLIEAGVLVFTRALEVEVLCIADAACRVGAGRTDSD